MTHNLTLMTDLDATLEHLNRVIGARGRGGAFSVAVDLGVDPSIISHWRARRRTPSPDMTHKISALPVIDSHDSHDSDIDHDIHDGPLPDHDTHDSHHDADHDRGAGDAQTVNPGSLEDLEAAVLGATPQDRIEVGNVNLDTGPGLPPPSSEWRQQVWLPANDMIAGFVGPPGGPLISKQARSGHGNMACEAFERAAHRMGLENALYSGHWMMDLAVMGSYVVAVIKMAQSGQMPGQPMTEFMTEAA